MLYKVRNQTGSKRQMWAELLVVLAGPLMAWGDKHSNSAPAPQQQQRSAPPPSRPAPPPPQPQRPAYQQQQQPQPATQRPSTMPQQRPAYQPPANNRGTPNNNVQRPAGQSGNSGNNRINPNASHTANQNPYHNPGAGNGSGQRGPQPGQSNGETMGRPGQSGSHLGGGDSNAGRGPRGPGRDYGHDAHNSGPQRSFTPPRRDIRDIGNHHVSFDSHHHIRDIHSVNGMDIHRGLRHDRVVERTYPGGRRVVSMGPHRGFAERPYINRGGHAYIQRTYIYGGHRYAYAYRTYYWGGHPYYRYAPAYYYHPVFYGWAYNPWPAPVYYGWGWGPAPWYGYYGYYFAPAPYYPTASLWLTDFLLAENLKMAYEAQQQSNLDASASADAAPASGAVRLSPEVKQAIAAEVQEQLRAEQQASNPSSAPQPASSDTAPPPALDPSVSVFVVSGSLAVSSEDGQECELTAGDVLSRIDDTPGDDNAVQVRVTASKQSDCRTGSRPRVQVTDLQEMHNHFREQIDAGLQTLAAGGKGLPKAPDTGTSSGEVPPPRPDDVDAQLQQEQKDADQTEREVTQQAPAGQGGHQ